MTKAEEAAFEAYPYAPSELNTFEHQTIAVDSNSRDRAIYLRGYEQAERDLAPDPQENELNATAFLTELGYTIIPPSAKFSPANVATLAKHLLAWAEQAPKDNDLGWEGYRREIIKDLAVNAISESCGLTSEYITNRSDIPKAVKNARLVADMIINELKEEKE